MSSQEQSVHGTPPKTLDSSQLISTLLTLHWPFYSSVMYIWSELPSITSIVAYGDQKLSTIIFRRKQQFQKRFWSLYCTVTQWPKVKEKYLNVTYISAPSPFFSLWFQIEQWNLYVDSTCTCSYMYKFIMYKSFLMFSPCVQTLHNPSEIFLKAFYM